ncbi:peroxidase-3 [Coleophoma cylindrospora]|uniref:Peroxidase n=1 Tax=Coleophoma cylindrospora TaxID=1849047 RepID=A0A3D8QDK5_9HELO|nr:peroxidase-3 [Coleophoma cylindrospora]
MKYNLIYLTAAATAVSAFPGMKDLMADLGKRQADTATVELLGDLLDGATTPVGQEVKDCLLGNVACQDGSKKTYAAPGPLGSPACAADTCCVWDFIQKDLTDLFLDCDGTCNELARGAVRFGFHDAAAWSKDSGFGGADGSLLISKDEILRSENRGMDDIYAAGNTLLAKYSEYGVGAGDLVQFMHNTATVLCPLGPRILTYVGREDSENNPTGLIPDTHSPAPVLIELFQNKTINFKDLIALIGAHTVANQEFVDPSQAGAPLDSTPGIWDVQFYNETLQATPPPGVFRLPSDESLKNDNTTARGFTVFADPVTGQTAWNAAYSVAYVRMSLLGVNNINKLTDCTKVLPEQVLEFTPKVCSSSSYDSATSVQILHDHTTMAPTVTPAPDADSYGTATAYVTVTVEC